MSSTKNPLHRFFGLDASAHGDQSGLKLDHAANLEVISLGLSRTGTTSLQFALEKLGFAPCHGGIILFRNPVAREGFKEIFTKTISGEWKAGDAALSRRLRELMQGYRSTTDMPLPYLPQETYAAYPDAKYILTTRPGGKDEWFRSVEPIGRWHHSISWHRYLYRFCVYPVGFLRRFDDMIGTLHRKWAANNGGELGPEVYDRHNKMIKALIPESQLLIFDVRQGWEPLCEFLDVPVPGEPFPNTNDAAAMRAIYTGMMSFGLFVGASYVAVALAAVYVAYDPSVISLVSQNSMVCIRYLLRL
ncbi:hypothetical protein KC343_g3415 [Hortaea werneckii]|nr:hypothetical protein KC352_g15157 [Hortaea werneckii]KAI7568527.1 hypothetical protein KC317_g4110 [Hortaea werneckii]KAI7622153.1 hypothetical protein KC346_g3347 [Hortaea werneckii]KAI7632577.1 hypothetical protein KC343_g3415 [Hortaea werneckii]KAI7658417.1 hypothetical protein KC319_g9246 [Hortaea werneckii]